MRPSDIAPTSGRAWSPDSIWNRPLGTIDDLRVDVDRTGELHDLDAPVTVRPSVPIYWQSVNTPLRAIRIGHGDGYERFLAIPAAHDYWCAVVINDATRTVYTLRDMHREHRTLAAARVDEADLDGDGTNESLLAGTVLERELAYGQIDHALRVFAPFPVGTRIQLDPDIDVDDYIRPPVASPIAVALRTYGAIVVAPGDGFEIMFERAATAGHDDHGPTYRQHGIVHTVTDTAIPTDALRALHTR